LKGAITITAYKNIKLIQTSNNDEIEDTILKLGNDYRTTLPSIVKSKSNLLYIIKNEKTCSNIGMVCLYNISDENKNAFIDGFVIDKKYTNELVYSLIQIIIKCFTQMNLNKINALHINGNQHYTNLFNCLKFVQEGVLRSHIKINEKYYDANIRSLLRHEFDRSYSSENKLQSMYMLEGFN